MWDNKERAIYRKRNGPAAPLRRVERFTNVPNRGPRSSFSQNHHDGGEMGIMSGRVAPSFFVGGGLAFLSILALQNCVILDGKLEKRERNI